MLKRSESATGQCKVPGEQHDPNPEADTHGHGGLGFPTALEIHTATVVSSAEVVLFVPFAPFPLDG